MKQCLDILNTNYHTDKTQYLNIIDKFNEMYSEASGPLLSNFVQNMIHMGFSVYSSDFLSKPENLYSLGKKYA